MSDNSQEIAPGVREGEIFAEKYRISAVLGSGGMGVVVAAHHIHLDERVAIKFLHSDALKNSEVVTRFIREARAAVKIKSEHVVRVLDVGSSSEGVPYMVMEYLEGEDLSQWLERRGKLTVEQGVEFVLQACEAIAEAHARGIVHRDLKPANLFVVDRADGLPSIRVLDFGISKLASWKQSKPEMAITKTSSVMGSPLYMSPEQMASSKDVDARADIWSLGVILYELLSAEVPFAGTTLPEICTKVSLQPPPSIRSICSEIAPQLEQVILRCLEKDRSKRYSNVAELAIALQPFGPRRSRHSVDRVVRVIDSAGMSTTAMTESEAPERPTTQLGGDTIAPPLGRTTIKSRHLPRPTVVALSVAGVAAGAALLLTVSLKYAGSRSPSIPQNPVETVGATGNSSNSNLPPEHSAANAVIPSSEPPSVVGNAPSAGVASAPPMREAPNSTKTSTARSTDLPRASQRASQEKTNEPKMRPNLLAPDQPPMKSTAPPSLSPAPSAPSITPGNPGAAATAGSSAKWRGRI